MRAAYGGSTSGVREQQRRGGWAGGERGAGGGCRLSRARGGRSNGRSNGRNNGRNKRGKATCGQVRERGALAMLHPARLSLPLAPAPRALLPSPCPRAMLCPWRWLPPSPLCYSTDSPSLCVPGHPLRLQTMQPPPYPQMKARGLSVDRCLALLRHAAAHACQQPQEPSSPSSAFGSAATSLPTNTPATCHASLPAAAGGGGSITMTTTTIDAAASSSSSSSRMLPPPTTLADLHVRISRPSIMLPGLRLVCVCVHCAAVCVCVYVQRTAFHGLPRPKH